MTVDTATPADARRWELYRLLGEPLRLRLLALAAEEELSVGELSDLLGESQPQISRHAAPLREAGLLALRKQGTRSFLQLAPGVASDPVVADALGSGHALIATDGSLRRIPLVVAERESSSRSYFAKSAQARSPLETGPLVAALLALMPRRTLAIDAGTGEGELLELLSPSFARVIGFDREARRIERAQKHAEDRALHNVELRTAEPSEIAAELAGSADLVLAVRVLHHAGKPGELLRSLAKLCRPESGALVVLDYAPHEDEAMRKQGDLWLGFEPSELSRFAVAAGLRVSALSAVPAPLTGPDAHLPWQVMVARAGAP